MYDYSVNVEQVVLSLLSTQPRYLESIYMPELISTCTSSTPPTHVNISYQTVFITSLIPQIKDLLLSGVILGCPTEAVLEVGISLYQSYKLSIHMTGPD